MRALHLHGDSVTGAAWALLLVFLIGFALAVRSGWRTWKAMIREDGE